MVTMRMDRYAPIPMFWGHSHWFAGEREVGNERDEISIMIHKCLAYAGWMMKSESKCK